MKRRIMQHENDGTANVVAEIELRDDGTLSAEYPGAFGFIAQADLEEHGIVVRARGKHVVLRLRDGRAFWDALPNAYVSSSRVSVVDVAE